MPDASHFYFKELPGQKLLFYIANSNHFINKLSQALLISFSFLAFL
ncbi:PhoPQ-activated protein PqaA family protein [Coxiella-like endosymbiont]